MRPLLTFLLPAVVLPSLMLLSGVASGGGLPAQAGSPRTISPEVPKDISGGAPNATIEQAAAFAWQEFIALNWPAVKQTGALNTRDTPDASKHFGDPAADALVWETFRGKTEIYPGQNEPNGYVSKTDLGYDAPPRYVYDPTEVGTYPGVPSGEVKPADPQSGTVVPAWVNLAEDNEIDEAAMFAGASSTSPFPGQQFLYAAKANRVEYDYVASNEWWNKETAPSPPPFSATATYINDHNGTTPPAGSTDYVSLPTGTIELKAAWRRLTPVEIKSGRFHIQTVRFYVPQAGNADFPAWREEVWGLCALHIIHKTPTAPYFVFATFSQADNILDVDGNRVEDEAGKVGLKYQSMSPMSPPIVSTPATATAIQTLVAQGNSPAPGKRLYYENLPDGIPGHRVPQGMISVNRRVNPIPKEVIAVNKKYQNAIKAYDSSNKVENSPWRYYKLVNVQWKPLDKAPGEPYTGPYPGSYYLSNEVVETDYNLQVFSGKLDDAGDPDGLITDFTPTNRGKVPPPYVPITNVPYDGEFYNMGGCMGCHGNIAELGSDFSFILFKSSVKAPEFQLDFASPD